MKFKKALLFTILLFATYSFANEKITFKAAKSSSSYYQMAVQLGESVNKITDDALSFTIEESQGSVQNVKEARKRAGNFIFSTPPALIKLAQNKQAMFKKDSPKDYEKIRALFVIPYLTMHFVSRKDANIKTFSDLSGKTLLIGKGSFGAREALKYIKLFGLEGKVKVVEAELSNAVNALKNSQIDAFATSGSFPAPNVLEAAASLDINILSFTDEQIKLTKRDTITIPANTYKGIDKAVSTTTLPVGIYTTTNMSDETAYKLVSSFWKSKQNLSKYNLWWNGITFENLNVLKTKLHNGALKYYKEKNVSIEGLAN